MSRKRVAFVYLQVWLDAVYDQAICCNDLLRMMRGLWRCSMDKRVLTWTSGTVPMSMGHILSFLVISFDCASLFLQPLKQRKLYLVVLVTCLVLVQ
jgi:hypothetical protein